MRVGRDVADRAAAHDPEQRVSRHQLHASEVVEGSPNDRGTRVVPQPDQVPRHVLERQ